MTADTLAGVAAESLVGVPGDPVLVNAMASHYEAVAASIRGAATRLRSLEAGSSSSDALDAFLVKAAQVSASLGGAEGRYGETGSALKAYASELSLAQEAAAPALANHRDAVDDLAAAEKLVERYEHFALVAADEVVKQEHLDQAAAQRTKAEEARGRVALYARRLTDAHRSVEAAANAAIAKIDDATDDGLADTLWDDLGGTWDAGFAAFQKWMEENDSWISTVLDVLTVVGAALAIAAIFFPLTCWIGPLALAVMVASTATEAARAVAGTGSWLDVGLSLLSVATFGVGGRALKLSVHNAQAKLAFSRVGGLVRGGRDIGGAVRSVNRSVSRVNDKVLRNPFKVLGLGDADVGKTWQWLMTSRVGAAVQDQRLASELLRRLQAKTALEAIAVAKDLADAVDVFGGFSDRAFEDVRQATTFGVREGPSW